MISVALISGHSHPIQLIQKIARLVKYRKGRRGRGSKYLYNEFDENKTYHLDYIKKPEQIINVFI